MLSVIPFIGRAVATAVTPRCSGRGFVCRDHEVVNAGYPSTGIPEEFRILKRFGMIYEPDLVLLSCFAGNDFGDSSPWRKRVVVNGIQVNIDVRTETTLFGFPIVPGWRVLQIARSYQVMTRDLEITEEIPAGYSCGYLKAPTFSEEAFQEIIPDELQEDPAVLERSLSAGGFKREDLELDRPQRLIREILEAERIPHVDLLPSFKQAARTIPLYVPRDTHWNRSDAELAAEQLSLWFKRD